MKKSENRLQSMDMEKVNKIKEEIRNGTFKINPEKIADKFINEIGVEYLLKTKKEMH